MNYSVSIDPDRVSCIEQESSGIDLCLCSNKVMKIKMQSKT